MEKAPEVPTASTRPRLYALVPCAGVGERAGVGGPKQYHPVGGLALVARTLDALAAVPRLHAVLVALAPGDTAFDAHVPGFRGWTARCGGDTRAATVAAGLEALRGRGASDEDWVLVHDAARCLITPSMVDRLIDACLVDPVGGLLALPVADTLKAEAPSATTGGPAHSARTVDRRGLWAAQTPQMFRLGLLARALERVGSGVTDEASAIEALGLQPLLVTGAADNLKITWPADFELAARWLQSRETPVQGEVEAELHALEKSLLRTHRPETFDPGSLLAADFIEIGTDGAIHDRATALAWLRRSDRPHYVIHGFQALPLAPGLYRVHYEAHRMAAELPMSRSRRSSVWRQGAGGWQLVFAQGTHLVGTPAASPTPASSTTSKT